MNLLEKFNAVTVDVTAKVSEADNKICRSLQKTYDTACVSLKRLIEVAQEAVDIQNKDAAELPEYHRSDYLGDACSVSDIHSRLQEVHGIFISDVIRWFRCNYKVDLDTDVIRDAILPEKPDRWDYDRNTWQQYETDLEKVHVRYEDVLEHIIAQLDGFSFEEKALNELKAKCHEAAYNTYRHEATYNQKKAVISLEYGCTYRDWGNPWRLTEAAKNIVKGLIMYEYGSIVVMPHPYTVLLGYDFLQQIVEVNTTKVASVKCFKNNRLDIRFTKEEYAREFVETFLETNV